ALAALAEGRTRAPVSRTSSRILLRSRNGILPGRQAHGGFSECAVQSAKRTTTRLGTACRRKGGDVRLALTRREQRIARSCDSEGSARLTSAWSRFLSRLRKHHTSRR